MLQLRFCSKAYQMISKKLLSERELALEWAAQGGGGVTIPAGVQKMFRCCIEGHDFLGNIDGRWTVELDDLGGLFQLW